MLIKILLIIEWVIAVTTTCVFGHFCYVFYRRFIKNVYPTYLKIKEKCTVLKSRGESPLKYRIAAWVVTFAPFAVLGYIAWVLGFLIRMLVDLTIPYFMS